MDMEFHERSSGNFSVETAESNDKIAFDDDGRVKRTGMALICYYFPFCRFTFWVSFFFSFIILVFGFWFLKGL